MCTFDETGVLNWNEIGFKVREAEMASGIESILVWFQTE